MEQSTEPSIRRVLIIGGGFVGLECARRLANNPRFDITLIDRNNHHLFQPLLYQVATASLAAPDIARSLRQILEKARNVTVLMDQIATLSMKESTATGQSGRVYSYDHLVLATGVRTSFFGHPEWEEHTLGLKTLAEAQAIRRTVLSNLEQAELSTDPDERLRLMTVAIVGGGPTGVELAGAFADLLRRSLKTNFRRIDTSTLRIVLIEGGDRILSAYDEDQSAYAEKRLAGLGVEVRTGTTVSKVTDQRVHLGDGETIDAAAIVWAAGTEASPLTAQLGVPLADQAGRVTPEPDLSIPGHPEVFVGGDLVSMSDSKGTPVPGVAPAAMQMGRHIAKVLKSEDEHSDDHARPAFRYSDKGIMAIIGKNSAVVKSGKLRLRAFPAWLAWLFIHLLFLVGFRNKLSVLLGWAFAYLRDTPDARIIVNPQTKDRSSTAQSAESYSDAA